MKLDKKIALGLVFALFLQTAGALLWTGAAAQRLEMVEEDIADRKGVKERLARVETELIAVRQQLDRIERKVERP